MASGLMLRLAELKLPLDHTEEELTQAVLRRLKIPPDQLLEHRLVRCSPKCQVLLDRPLYAQLFHNQN